MRTLISNDASPPSPRWISPLRRDLYRLLAARTGMDDA